MIGTSNIKILHLFPEERFTCEQMSMFHPLFFNNPARYPSSNKSKHFIFFNLFRVYYQTDGVIQIYNRTLYGLLFSYTNSYKRFGNICFLQLV